MGYKIYNAPEIMRTVNLARLRWLGHLTRTNETPPCRKINFPKPEGSRRAGGSSLNWLDSIERDLTILVGRNQWRNTMEEYHGGGQELHRVVEPVKLKNSFGMILLY
jgi:hypothetical protein